MSSRTPAPARLAAALGDRYRIERELGAGGMATVYVAHDLKHQRDVALKVLRPELAAVLGGERFLHEIRVTARLDHPHILTLIDSGEADGFLYYVLPLVRGESLRERLQRERQLGVDEALAITRQIAGALDYAHRQGVVHRDIKPENILLHEGEAMLADFGIALAVREAGGNRLTETGLSLGTPQYMSPEQATGERQLDERSDVYSLGAVLYEMLAGEPPVTGPTAQALIARLMTERPTRVRVLRDTVPEGVDAAVARALAKVPADRFPSAGAFAAALAAPTGPGGRHGHRARLAVVFGAGVVVALAGLGAYAYWIAPAADEDTRGAPGLDRSIAVLPFANLSDDPANQYFSDGVTDDILTKLAGIRELHVVSRTSVTQYRQPAKSLRQIGSELGVGLILEGTVQRVTDRVRITAQLIDARTDRHLWADSYERDLDDIFAVQDEIARKIADALEIRLTAGTEARLGRRPTDNLRAYDLYLRGRFFWNKRQAADIATAIDYFNQALEEDPTYALAHSGLAEAYAVPASPLPPEESLPRAKEAARRALELDSTLVQAQTALAYAIMLYDYDWDAAGRAFRRALELDPDYATAHQWYGEYLATLGRIDEAIAAVRRAEELDPLSVIVGWNVGRILYFARRYAEAVEQFEKVLVLDPPSGRVRFSLFGTYLAMGDAEKAVQNLAGVWPDTVVDQLREAAAAEGPRGVHAALLARDIRVGSRRSEADTILRARLSAALGDAGEAVRLLETLRQRRGLSAELTNLRLDPIYDPIRSDPRFIAFLERLGLQ